MKMLEHDCIFTNVAMTPDGDVWWEGMDGPNTDLIDWRGKPWKRGTKEPAAHPNSRFTAPMDNIPKLSRYATDPRGVPISSDPLRWRRTTTVPLVVESFNWTHGVYLGATAGAETTAAITGAVGRIRRDPMAMLAFIGYDAGTYFSHWLSMFGRMSQPPKIFLVNWFRKAKTDGTSGPATARTCASSSGSSIARPDAPGRWRRRSATRHASAISICAASTRSTEAIERALHVDHARMGEGARGARRLVREARWHRPESMRLQAPVASSAR
jgi:hypothetical protein